MTGGRQDDDGPRQQGVAGGGVRILLVVALTVFAIALSFVLIYTTDIPWFWAALISVVLAGAQAYGLRRTLSRRDDGNSGTGV
jgi:4-hydroxybenzoate polyprenyltransferase